MNSSYFIEKGKMQINSRYKEVQKSWGKEIWIVNGSYCGKILVLNKGYRCSLHHHKNKDETFYVSKGKVLIELEEHGKLEKAVMNEGESLRVMPGQKHRFTGLEESKIIEFSTHHEDSDSYRNVIGGKADINEIVE